MEKGKGKLKFKFQNRQQEEKLNSANAKKNNITETITKSRKRQIIDWEEKDSESSPFLNRKRKRPAIKRGTNCAWTVEDVS